MRRDFDARLRAARCEQAERDSRALDAALRDVIGGLRPGAGSTVIDLSPGQITVTTVYLDAVGSPRVGEGRGLAWTSLLPMLSATERERHAQLADGVDGLDGDDIASKLADRVPPVCDDRTLVIVRPAGWRVLEAAATAFAGRPRGRGLRICDASGIPVREKLADLAASAPLRHPYLLMTAVVDGQTGAVTLRPRELFAVGAGPGTEACLTLRRMPGDAAGLTLAIFAGTGDAMDAGRVLAGPLALFSVPPAGSPPTGPRLRLRAVLDGPGRVRIEEPSGAVPHARTWAQVRGQVPSRITMAAAPVDLVCAIDAAGPRDIVRRRIGLVRDLVRLLDTAYPDGRHLRVGLVTCTDHVFGRRRGAEYDPVTSVCELGTAAQALAWLGGTSTADIQYPPCAPVEDLLNESLRMLTGSLPAGRMPRLLTVAGRSPHPYPQPIDTRLPCPRKLVWQHLMDQLTGEAGVRCAVVADRLPGGAGRGDWRRLGPAGQRPLSGATARQVAEDLGLLASKAQHIPFPLIDEPPGAPD